MRVVSVRTAPWAANGEDTSETGWMALESTLTENREEDCEEGGEGRKIYRIY